MKILYDWLKEFVDFSLAPAELRSRLSLCGIAVEGLEQTAAGPLLDAALTINRPDCLSHYGIAREAAAIVDHPLALLDDKLPAPQSRTAPVKVSIEAPELCGRFTARALSDVRIKPSTGVIAQRFALASKRHGLVFPRQVRLTTEHFRVPRDGGQLTLWND